MGNDLSTIFVGMSTDVDANFKTDSVGVPVTKTAAIAIRSDEIRIVARNGMKIVVEGGELIVDAPSIVLGKDASEHAVLGDRLVSELTTVLTALTTAPIGLLGQLPVPMNPAILGTLNQVKNKLDKKILSTINKIK